MQKKPLRTRKKPAKKPTRSKVVSKLDQVFSLYIRNKHAKSGWVQCVTCNRKYEIKKIQNGHFISRKNYATRWNEENCAPQCYGCNVMQQGQQFLFSKYIDSKYGDGKAEELLQKSREVTKFSTLELQEMIEIYQEKLKKLLRT
jgi:hypothetical protein